MKHRIPPAHNKALHAALTIPDWVSETEFCRLVQHRFIGASLYYLVAKYGLLERKEIKVPRLVEGKVVGEKYQTHLRITPKGIQWAKDHPLSKYSVPDKTRKYHELLKAASLVETQLEDGGVTEGAATRMSKAITACGGPAFDEPTKVIIGVDKPIAEN